MKETMMNTRFKLATIAGLEALSGDINPEELQTHTTDGELSADDAVIENQINYEMSEATSDVKASMEIAEEFSNRQLKQEQAVTDLEAAVEGLEKFFEGEFSLEGYKVLMNHASRCATRAGVELPIKLDGMESMTSASVYLETRNGLEGFMDVVKKAGTDFKNVIITIYKYFRDVIKGWLAQFGGMESKIDHALKLLSKTNTLNSEIKVGKWNRYLDINKKRLFKTSDLHPLATMANETGKVKLTDVLTPQDLPDQKYPSVDTLSDVIVNRDLEYDRRNSGENIELYTLEIANLCLRFTIPGRVAKGIGAFEDFKVLPKEIDGVDVSTHSALFSDKRMIEQELKEMLTFVKSVKKTFETIDRELVQERDTLVATARTLPNGVSRRSIIIASSAKRRVISGCETAVYNLLDAKYSALRAHF
ncbi:internal head protein [Vibrio phage USC-1]|uniref:Uncharacterized protein n=2 Tax=Aphroditevirus USC1 TaxID=2846605 RepID=A0A514A2K0_9CAUD|nr:internal head protein [Vibrio phage USC-1]QCW23253.1 hypothetical protein [Vibrio phage 5 TSL-2019]QDH47475.1 hypothetical protein [Vibrio phage USC-1]